MSGLRLDPLTSNAKVHGSRDLRSSEGSSSERMELERRTRAKEMCGLWGKRAKLSWILVQRNSGGAERGGEGVGAADGVAGAALPNSPTRRRDADAGAWNRHPEAPRQPTSGPAAVWGQTAQACSAQGTLKSEGLTPAQNQKGAETGGTWGGLTGELSEEYRSRFPGPQ